MLQFHIKADHRIHFFVRPFPFPCPATQRSDTCCTRPHFPLKFEYLSLYIVAVVGSRFPPKLGAARPLLMSLGKTAKLPMGSESEERGIQIRTLREHEPNNVLRLLEGPGCTPRGKPWRKNHSSSPAFKNRNSNPTTATVTSENNGITQLSCSVVEEKARAMVCNSASAASAAVGLNATRSTNLLCRQQENHVPTSCESFPGNHIGSSISTGTVTSNPDTTTVASAMTTSTTDDGIYDPEDLLLEPLLSSPRSDRERKATSCGESGPGNSNICGNNMLQEGRIMPQCITNSSNHQVPESMSDRGEGEVLPSSSGAMSSSTIHPSGLLSRPLVPVSPALSEVQGSSFIPGCDQSPRRSAAGGGSGGVAGSGSGFAGDNETWYLNFPPNNQQHHRHQAHLYQVSTTAVASAARLAAEAANVAAAIQQATGPFSPGQPGSYAQDYPNDPSVGGAAGMRTQDTNGGSVGRSSVGNGGNLLAGGIGGGGSMMCSVDYNSYPEESSRTSWSTVPSSWQTQPKGALGRPNGSGACQQRPRSLTREECVQGSCHPRGDATQNQRGDSEWLAPYGNGVEESRTHGNQQMHGLSNNSPYTRTSQYDLGGGGNSNGSGSKRMKILGAADVTQGWILSQNTSVGVGATSSHNASSNKGWRSSGLGIRTGGAPIAAEISPPVGVSTAVPDSTTPRKCSLGRTKVSAMPASPAAGAASEASPPEGNNDSDTNNAKNNDNGGVSAESGGGESSSDWVEREESEEESKAKPKGSGCSSSVSGGGNGPKAKVPFMLDPTLWIVVERRAICTAKQCAYRR